jgi:glycolate oxidase FAD binding subunit
MNVTTQSLSEALATLVGSRARPADASDSVAGVQPQMVVQPESEQEVAEVLALADSRGEKVLVRGGGTQQGLGAPPSGGDVLLDMRRLNQIVEHAPHDQTVTVQAGLRLVDLQAALAQTRQWLALDAVLAEDATIGGIIATNVSGARRLRFGGVRDQLIGIQVALADGTIARGGGKVVKNVAGYDLPKLFTGALGTLGVILTATFRLYPLPAASRTIALEAAAPDPLAELAVRILGTTLVPTALDLLGPSPADGAVLAVRFESGVAATVEEQAEAVLALVGGGVTPRSLTGDDERAFWQQAAAATAAPAGEGTSLLLKASVVPTEVSPWLDDLMLQTRVAGVQARWRAHAGHGLIFVRLEGEDAALSGVVGPLREAARARGGSLVVQDAPVPLLRTLDVWGPIPALEVMRRLKTAFDPKGTLTPGRFVGGI